MLFADIAQAGSDAARILYYPRVWEDENAHTGRTWKRLMRAAELEYDVLLRPLEGKVDERTVLTAAFAETGFSRVAWLDHGGSLLHSLDDLLLSLPPAIVAKPWRAEGRMWILEPAVSEAERLLESEKSVHELYAEHTLVFPQHPWFLETAEFRRSEHAAYLRPAQTWEPVAVRDAVAYLSFRDPEVPMPWTQISGGVLERVRPRDSSDAEVWWMLYRKWERSRADVCGLDLEAPEKAI
ncbi:hypothetical protein FN846DRAFT_784113 [Sphaerosporella brunnea]|uniref:Uncharacterized protein n=1 Tax=Sphaerosporella brunnea TaxID=1250544 RepID=A0A5J5EKW9_9PEZI|nr:hypothetical protein FN846DRAFT_784113 [Sphaerosporella brunnea]